MARRNSRLRALSAAAALAGSSAFAGIAGPAMANGGDFFAEFAAQMNQSQASIGPSYFGFVRDERGRTVQGASVTATITTSGSAMTVRTDVLGHYQVPGFALEIDPASVEISCKKPGYSQISSARRQQNRSPDAPVETDCLLAVVTAEAS